MEQIFGLLNLYESQNPVVEYATSFFDPYTMLNAEIVSYLSMVWMAIGSLPGASEMRLQTRIFLYSPPRLMIEIKWDHPSHCNLYSSEKEQVAASRQSDNSVGLETCCLWMLTIVEF